MKQAHFFREKNAVGNTWTYSYILSDRGRHRGEYLGMMTYADELVQIFESLPWTEKPYLCQVAKLLGRAKGDISSVLSKDQLAHPHEGVDIVHLYRVRNRPGIQTEASWVNIGDKWLYTWGFETDNVSFLKQFAHPDLEIKQGRFIYAVRLDRDAHEIEYLGAIKIPTTLVDECDDSEEENGSGYRFEILVLDQIFVVYAKTTDDLHPMKIAHNGQGYEPCLPLSD